MALKLARLIDRDVANSDRENIDRLFEECMCGGGGDESDTEECKGRSSDEDDLFDDNRNDFDDVDLDAMPNPTTILCRIRLTKNWQQLPVFGMYDYHLRLLYTLSKYVYHMQCKHFVSLSVVRFISLHEQWHS